MIYLVRRDKDSYNTFQTISNIYEDPGNGVVVGFIPHTHAKFKDVELQFLAKWTGGKPTVQDVLILFPAKAAFASYLQYRKQLEAAGNFTASTVSFYV
jgi:hypothetical protein